ncbi:MAG: hypothetical protein L6R40_006820 [Gallowayella cf. fulva]|nr:MAG: hypothetical protein L6R40_006820 [Xanthomendoza cf. fulva]
MPAYSVPGMHGDAKSSEAARLRDVIKYLRQDMTSFKKPLELVGLKLPQSLACIEAANHLEAIMLEMENSNGGISSTGGGPEGKDYGASAHTAASQGL